VLPSLYVLISIGSDSFQRHVKKVNLSLLCHEDIWESGGIAPPFLTSVLDGGEWSASLSCRFIRGERAPGTYWIGGWVGSRAGLDSVEET
jgi:hypothetical protein